MHPAPFDAYKPGRRHARNLSTLEPLLYKGNPLAWQGDGGRRAALPDAHPLRQRLRHPVQVQQEAGGGLPAPERVAPGDVQLARRRGGHHAGAGVWSLEP